MTVQTDAIYEGGVLRPLTPLQLREHQTVSLTISTVPEGDVSDEAARQRSVIMEYMAHVESRPDDTPQDGLSNRDHDRLIYGE